MKQGEIWYTNLDPVKGSEQAGYTPIVILSGNLLNTHTKIIIAAPLTTKVKNYKGNPILEPNANNCLTDISEVLVFHIRSIAKERLIKRVGFISKTELELAIKTLNEILRY
ncbi:type II toxin-antitoxin system PemK/MazF family toxin [Pedobacter sp. SD-b]|uniref:mRNA interferase n=1 Tax=Pedobacter segetis TaxID=2793069 RepID=A0ABS1BHE8_9SPHI|nr:type II toxin-antitoxin system PemK/MazF family toxin [Pedobacter segetis]MBK0382309.1 type II toxin-antitoxin system PemK/MazF family toxin [Pedobacter segetis]